MKQKNIFIVFVIAFLASCGNAGNTGNAYISGTIKNVAGKTIYLEELTPEKIIVMDSAVVGKDGSFSIKTKAKSVNYYRLRIGKEQPPQQYAAPTNIIVFISDSSEKLVVEAEVTADSSEIRVNPAFKIKGSKETDLLMELNAFLLKGEQSIDSLNKQFNANPQTFDKIAAQGIYEGIQAKRADYARKFINDHPENFVILQVLPFLNPDQELDAYKKVSESLNKKFPNNGWVKNFAQNVEKMSFLAIGSVAPDFTVKTPADQNISLSGFKGKYVLLDFWASWCRPCRAENPNLVAAYGKYASKGFTIFSVSLDQQKEPWVQAIKDDKMVWEHGSDLLYWDAAPAKLYNISTIPYNLLLDKEGKIIAKNLRGEDLEKQLAAILK